MMLTNNYFKLLVASSMFFFVGVASVNPPEVRSQISPNTPHVDSYWEISQFKNEDIDSLGKVTWSPDGKRIAGRSGEKIHIWDGATGEMLITIYNKTSVRSISWSPDGTRIAVGGSVEGWNIDLPVGRYEGDGVWIWDVQTGELINHFSIQYVSYNYPHLSSISWSLDGNILAAGALDGAIHLWNVQTNERLKGSGPPLLVGPETYYINSVSLSPDGLRLAIASSDGIGVVSVGESGLALDGYSLTLNPVTVVGETWSIAWNPDNRRLASAGLDHVIHLWDVNTKQILLSFGNKAAWVRDLTWNPDGKRLTGVSDNPLTVIIWDGTTGEELAQLPIERPNSVSWSPDGSRLAIGSDDGIIHIWGEQNTISPTPTISSAG